MKKYGFFDFHGPELIIYNHIQDGIMTMVNPKGPPFQQKKIRVLRSTIARDIQF